MKINDEAIIVKLEKFAEEGIICWALMKEHGLFKGVVKPSNKLRNQMQISNIINFTWSARTIDQLGSLYGELLKPISMVIINDKFKLASIRSLCSLLVDNLPEKVREKNIYNAVYDFILNLKDNNLWLEDYLLLELIILRELGYGLSLDKCAVTGKKEDLYYVSPKSGMAVSKDVGKEYHSKLLVLPQFYGNRVKADLEDINNAFKLNEYFINKFLYHHKGERISSSRMDFYSLIIKKSDLRSYNFIPS